MAHVFTDETGTNFGQTTPETDALDLPFAQGSVYAWNLDDFNVNYDNWTAGSQVSLLPDAEPDVVSIVAPQAPFFHANIPMYATGTVADNSGGSATFNDTLVAPENYWQFNASLDGGATTTPFWITKLSDGTNDFLVTNYAFAYGGTISLVNVDNSPGFKTADTTDFESLWDVATNGTATDSVLYGNNYPRIDLADSPLAPAHLGSRPNGSDTSWDNLTEANFAAYKSSAIVISSDNSTISVVPDETNYAGKFFTGDNDAYFSDGSNDYSTTGVNDNDQYGRAEFADGTVINQQIFQAEVAYQVEFTNSAGVPTTANILRISFGNFGSNDYVWFVTRDFEFGATDYTVTEFDIAPGFDNELVNELSFQYSQLLVCFVAGTGIETIDGIKSVEDIRAGDFVLTKDNGYQQVRWIGSSVISNERLQSDPKLLPVRISAGALAYNVPSEDLYVSRQHRVLLGSKIVERMFDQEEVLMKAKDLVGVIPGVEFVEITADLEGDVEYYHILFDQHEVINSNGAFTESFYIGENSMMALDEDARAEIHKIFPEFGASSFAFGHARKLVSGNRARNCLSRHINSETELLPEYKV